MESRRNSLTLKLQHLSINVQSVSQNYFKFFGGEFERNGGNEFSKARAGY